MIHVTIMNAIVTSAIRLCASLAQSLTTSTMELIQAIGLATKIMLLCVSLASGALIYCLVRVIQLQRDIERNRARIDALRDTLFYFGRTLRDEE